MNKMIYRLMSFVVSLSLTLGVYFSASALSVSESVQAPKLIYVNPGGNDSNSGSATAPFKTFAKAVSVLTAGDTLQVMAGTYSETLTLSTSGSATAPITVIGSGAIVNMQGIKANGIVISGTYINVSGFEVMGATDFGILVTGKYDRVENNIVHDNVTRNGVGTCGLSTSWGSAVKVKVGGENTVIRNNTVYNNCGEGIAVTRGVIALVENNTTYDNFNVNIYVDNSPFVTVQNNMSYCTGTHLHNGDQASGIALGEETYSGWGAQLHDVWISGNTITDCRTGISVYESDVDGTLTNVTITNNNVPSGQKRGISLQTTKNQNVLVSNNTIFNDIYIYQTTGVTLVGNVVGGIIPTSTSMPPSPTSTMLVLSFTPTLVSTATNTPTPIPTSTMPISTTTASPAPAQPTATEIPPMPTTTATASPIPAEPTMTLTSAPPTSTVKPTSQPISETFYDDTNSAFIYSDGWEDVTKKQAYTGSFKLTTRNGSFVTFAFTGESFSVLYKGGPAFRKMDVYVDDVLVGTIDEKTAKSSFQQRWDYAGQLVPGTHALKLVFVTPNKSNKTNGSIDAVIVR